jgi:hypothetical protein
MVATETHIVGTQELMATETDGKANAARSIMQAPEVGRRVRSFASLRIAIKRTGLVPWPTRNADACHDVCRFQQANGLGGGQAVDM